MLRSRRVSPVFAGRLVAVLAFALLLTSFLMASGDQMQSVPVDLAGYLESLPPKLFEVSSKGLTLAKTAAGTAEYVSAVVASPFAFNAVGIKLNTDIEDPGLVQVYARTSNDSNVWGEWVFLSLEERLDPKQAAERLTEARLLATQLLFKAAANGFAVQIKIVIKSPLPEQVTIFAAEAVFIDSTHGPTEYEILERVTSQQSQNRPLPPAAGDNGPFDAYPKPSVVSRASWGADPAQGTLYYRTVTHICLHHTAGAHEWNSSGFSECAANVRATQDYHMGLGWVDIGYNYLVCKHGLIWEGRQGGDDVVGAHDAHNWGSMGASSMGYFHTPYYHVPTTAMLDSLADLFAWKCDQRGIDPLGSGYYYGYGGTMDNIYGHRQVGSTACPGDELQTRLPAIKADVDDRLNGGGWSVVLDTGAALTKGTWVTGTMAPDKYGSNYLWNDTTPGGREGAGWRFSVPKSGNYNVSVWWSQGTNRTSQARFAVRKNGSYTFTTKNQQVNGGQWNSIGTHYFVAGQTYMVGVITDAPSGYVVICDAAQIEEL